LPQRSQVVLEPRKSPVQARSAASVDAILDATVQVLLRVGKERLTTWMRVLRVFQLRAQVLSAMLTKNLPCEDRGFKDFVLQMVGENVTRTVTKRTP
jgi:hypothetical protein